LTVGTVSQDYSNTVPKGSVISQNPTAGTQVEKGTAVNLVISKGKNATLSFLAVKIAAAQAIHLLPIYCLLVWFQVVYS
jgi:beta-lactam-binding protein with PASTA domain